MSSYFSRHTLNSGEVSEKYIRVNNCGYNEDITESHVRRKNGRVDYQLIYVKSGQVEFITEGGNCLLGEGNVYLYRPGEPQNYSVYGDPATFFWIHFTGREAEQMLSFFTEKYYYIGELPEFERYCRSSYVDFRIAGRYNELLYEGELIALIARLADRISRDKVLSNDLSKIDGAVTAMNASLTPRLSNEELAALCGLNKYYFIKLFKRAVGMPPQQYYASLIIDKSKQLLESTEYNISEISRLCGIDDSLYFSRMFKKHIGVSPAIYRQMLR